MLHGLPEILHTTNYWLSEHPSIVQFQWSPIHSWASTWLFLFTSISTYIATSTILYLLLLLFRRRGIPLGPIPNLHSLIMAIISTTIFVGTLSSTAAEIRDTRWFWGRSRNPLQWLLCFPLGTRSSGRVFFWSYIFYLSRFIQTLGTFFTILKYRKLSFFQILNDSVPIFMSFLWLEFSQSSQVLIILSITLIHALVYGHKILTIIMEKASLMFRSKINYTIHSKTSYKPKNMCFSFVADCQILLVLCNLICHVGVIWLHFLKGGCNGIGAWAFNSVLNVALIVPLLRFYVNILWSERMVFVASSISGKGDVKQKNR